ncbi:hypothetical protein COO60DRAFT_1551413 [Scenedesmus sp. NREL 46B-D3]|nr:hypothetical protein COO60DRAFT_1551413 [Scenedesmus sp. NREL 46B-D3]
MQSRAGRVAGRCAAAKVLFLGMALPILLIEGPMAMVVLQCSQDTGVLTRCCRGNRKHGTGVRSMAMTEGEPATLHIISAHRPCGRAGARQRGTQKEAKRNPCTTSSTKAKSPAYIHNNTAELLECVSPVMGP